MVAGGGLREDEKKADRERERVAGVRGNGTRVGGAGDGTRGVGWVVGWSGGWVGAGRRGGRRSFADVVEDEASECTRNEATARARRRTDPFSSD